MPSPVRRSVLAVVVLLAAALLAAGSAAGGNGGVAPPPPQSPNAERINDIYWVVMGVAGGVLVLVLATLLIFIVRFRNRGRSREAEGPQVVGHTRLELAWTAIPILILAAISAFTFYKLPGITNVPKATAGAEHVSVTVDAHQFYWRFVYPNGTVSIDELRVPVNRVVRINIRSADVPHSWWIPELSGKFDAIPGAPTDTWFRARKAGTYRGQCGEFCGIFHAQMNARVVATSEEEYRDWVTREAPAQLGESLWEGACAKCHEMDGSGDFGPDVRTNPTLTRRDELYEVVRNGQGRMPPVANNWTNRELAALLAYVRREVYQAEQQGAPGGS